MSQTGTSEIQGSYLPAMVFTNTSGRVIFVNRNFNRLKRSAVGIISGDLHLHDILPLSAPSAKRLFASVSSGARGSVAQWPMMMPNESGAPWDTTCTAVPVFDLHGTVIGIDFVMQDPALPGTVMPGGHFNHSDMVDIYVTDVFNQSRLNQNATFTQSYVIAQLEVLQIMVARVGGPSTRHAFEQVIAKTIRDNLITCTIQTGFLGFTGKNIDIQKYSLMLKSSIGYAVDAVGKQFVKQEMLTVDQSIEPGLLQMVSQLDLKAIFSS